MRQLVWILPFFSFLAGYYILKNLCVITELEIPALVGLPIHDAVVTLSDLSLNPRIIAHQEEPDLPSGTILSQNPPPGQKIKPHQSIFLVVSKTPEKPTMPNLIGKHEQEIEEQLQPLRAPYKKYPVASNAPCNTCFAQCPEVNEEVTSGVTIYYSAANHKHVIMPTLKNVPVSHALEFLQKHHVASEIIHTYPQPFGHRCEQCVVVDQRPLEGSLITINAQSKLLVQLKVASNSW